MGVHIIPYTDAKARAAAVSDAAYGAAWDGVTNIAPSKNAVYDKVQTIISAYTEGARVYNDAHILLSDDTWTLLTFNSERYDTDDIHSIVSNTGLLVCKTAGVYEISASVRFQANATGVRYLSIWHSSGVHIVRQSLLTNDATHDTWMNSSTQYDLAVDESVAVYVYQNSGGDLYVYNEANLSPEFMMQRIG